MLTLLADNLPMPRNDKYRPFAEYMEDRLDHFNLMVWVLLFVVVCLAIAFTVFAYQKFMERIEIAKERRDIKKWRDEILELTATATALMSTVKGWTVIYISDQKHRVDEVRSATREVKEAVEKIPEKTLELVKGNVAPSDDGDLPTVK